MNFQECFNILNHRMHNPAAECAYCKRTQPTSKDSILPPVTRPTVEQINEVTETSFPSFSFDQLSQRILDIQNDRLKTYQRFNDELAAILTNDHLHIYPNVCRHYTDIFSNLSQYIIRIKEELRTRGQYESLVEIIERLQLAEKDKLLIVAASHLEKLKTKLPDLQESLGPECEIQNKYLNEKLGKINEAVSEFTEEIICCRIDLLEKEGQS